jgi:hypothetical protein
VRSLAARLGASRARVALARPVQPGDFTERLDHDAFRALESQLDGDAFEQKWRASLQRPVSLLAVVSAGVLPGLSRAPGHAAGAPRRAVRRPAPGNFGFLRLDGETVYAFNDLDDGGEGPVSVDAVRYFTALRLAGYDDARVAAVLDRYVATVSDPANAPTDPPPRGPDWEKVRHKLLDKYTREHHFAHGAETGSVTGARRERAAVEALFRDEPQLRGAELHDLAVANHDGGGSGRHAAVLGPRVARRRAHHLGDQAGRAAGGQRATPGPPWETRLPFLQRALWGRQVRDEYFYATLAGRRFLVRDRAHKKDFDLEDLGPAERDAALRAQAGIAARVHAPGWAGAEATSCATGCGNRARRWRTAGARVARRAGYARASNRALSTETMAPTSAAPHISRAECIESIGPPTSTVGIPSCGGDQRADRGAAGQVRARDEVLARHVGGAAQRPKPRRGQPIRSRSAAARWT